MMKLYHYSDRIIPKLWQVEYPDHYPRGSGKPNGFWVSVGDDWISWCQNADFKLHDCVYKHRIHLQKDHGCLIITTKQDLFQLIETYGCDMYKSCGLPDEFPRHPSMSHPLLNDPLFDMSKSYIDWSQLYEKYKGIIFVTYDPGILWGSQYRLLTWYSCLDCASGCIWDMSAIESFKRVRNRKITSQPAESCSRDVV